MDDNGLLYLRARYYSPELGVFTGLDPLEGDIAQAMSLNRYGYVGGNVINAVDPSGMITESPGLWDPCSQISDQCELKCSIESQLYAQFGIPGNYYNLCVSRCRTPEPNHCTPSGNTACERFASEIRCIIEQTKANLEDYCSANLVNQLECLLSPNETSTTIDILAAYYSGASIGPIAGRLDWLPQTQGAGVGERYEAELYGANNNYEWDSPALQHTKMGQDRRAAYGFKRPYFANTHHYFGYLKYAYYYSSLPGELWNESRELQNLDAAIQEIEERLAQGSPVNDHLKRYRWLYEEGINDLYIVSEAGKMAKLVAYFGIDILPDAIESEWCANDEADVWSLESEVREFYNDFPEHYWPENVEARYGQ